MYKIKLEFEKKAYDLQACYYSCYNTPPSAGTGEEYYNTNPSPHSMTWTIKPGKMDQALLDWCTLAGQETRSGKITISEAESNAPLKVITFQGAFCSGFSESVDSMYDYNQTPASISVMVQSIAIKLLNVGKGIAFPN